MARDNIMRASVSFDITEQLCNNNSVLALNEFVDKLREQYGPNARIEGLECEFTDHNNERRRAVPNARDVIFLGRGQPITLRAVLETDARETNR